MADFGVIGIAVMGKNLVMNVLDHGFRVAVYNRTVERVDEFVAGEGKAYGERLVGTHSLEAFVAALARPRKMMILVRAGPPVDAFIDKLLQLVEPGDILIDGGNSNFHDTERREARCRERGVLFVGMGVSGGEEGARHGPSLMPGGDERAWTSLKPILTSIAAKAGDAPCCDWVGSGASGHFVKMVHNGIEYGDMQLICEAYQVMREGLSFSAGRVADVFKLWNTTELDSYLIDITAQILEKNDERNVPVVDTILDVAGQKGTGKWAVEESLSIGTPTPMLAEAVYARFLSGRLEERRTASAVFGDSAPKPEAPADVSAFVEDLRLALYASKILSYAQGYMLLADAAKEHAWQLNYGGIALMWRGGCIIRSVFLGDIKKAFDRDPQLSNLVLDPFFRGELARSLPSLRRVVAWGALNGVALPTFASAIAFFDAYRSGRLPAALLQAQRDFFGAHMFERLDGARGDFFHFDWTGHGGMTTASAYTA